jgi:uncharacterized protein YmfQ (DUF2313 family)
MTFLRVKTEEEHNEITAKYLLDGRHMRAKFIDGKVMFLYNLALSKAFKRVEEKLNEFALGRILTKSTVFVPEWEKAVQIPDDNLPGTGTIENRQRQALGKLSSDDMHTAEELEWLCSVFGFSVTVWPGHYFWRNPDIRVSFSSEKESRFTIVFEYDLTQSPAASGSGVFPVPFPWKFYSNTFNILQSYMLTIIDSNVNGLWINANAFDNVLKDTIDDETVLKDTIDDPEVLKDTFGV